jgi:nitrate reductase NapE component
MLLSVYLCGWLVTTIGALVAADRRRSRPLSVGLLAVLAGVLWPVLAIGVVELIAIVVLARMIRAASARQSDQAPMERDEVLI